MTNIKLQNIIRTYKNILFDKNSKNKDEIMLLLEGL